MRGLPSLYSLIPLLLILIHCGIADLRTDLLRNNPIPEDIQEKARDLLNNPPEPSLSPSLWKDNPGLEVFLVDYWNSRLIRFFTPIPERVQAMRVKLSTTKNTIHIKLTDGRQRGRIFGVEEGEPYTYDSKNGRVFNKDSDIQIYSESLRIYLLLPFQVHSYSKLAYLGDVEIGNQEYYEIFATNGDWEASDAYDQYRLYVQKETGKIDYIMFTYRDVFSFYKGILHYEDYTLYKGRLFPTKIAIQDDFMSEKYTHQLQIGNVKFLPKEPTWED